MGLLSFLKRKSGEPAARSASISEPVDSVQQARTRARQRLVGAVVLVAAGVIGFPLLFETQPRPLPGNTPIEIARTEGSTATPLSSRATSTPTSTPRPAPAAPAPTLGADPPAQATPEVAAASAAAPAESPKPEPRAEPAPAEPPPSTPKPAPKPAPKPDTKPAEAARAQALLEGKPPVPRPVAAEGRFIVQVGAFSEASAAREARQKVEKLGLKTYTQMIETSGGPRIRVRVGPFASRDEAERASSKIKSAGLSSAVYTL